jgi:hypothetical protein
LTFWGSNPGGGKIFRTRPDRPWGPPSLLYNGYRTFPGVKQSCSAVRAITVIPIYCTTPCVSGIAVVGRIVGEKCNGQHCEGSDGGLLEVPHKYLPDVAKNPRTIPIRPAGVPATSQTPCPRRSGCSQLLLRHPHRHNINIHTLRSCASPSDKRRLDTRTFGTLPLQKYNVTKNVSTHTTCTN